MADLPATLASDVQKPTTSGLVELYEIDTAIHGGGIYRLTPSTQNGATVYFNNLQYFPAAIKGVGFEVSGEEKSPRPTLQMAPTDLIRAAVATYNSLIGSKVTRIRTLEKYLDGQPTADPTAKFPLNVNRISRVTGRTKTLIEWELSSYIDIETVMVPRRQVLRDACLAEYRFYNSATSAFDYTRATCPYTGDSYFKTDGTETEDPSEDQCGRKLSDCKLRFPDLILPTWAFPGVSRVRRT
jgi:lambda family phage minor tail protein L